MEKLRPMTAKEKLCHVSNQMLVHFMACKHLLHHEAVTSVSVAAFLVAVVSH